MPPELVSRRSALTAALGFGAAALGATGCGAPASPGAAATPAVDRGGDAAGRTFGAEWERHARTIMAWPASTGIWGADLPDVQADIARLARAVSEFESVVLLAAPADQDRAQAAVGADVEVVPIPTDDLWARDTAPVFVRDGGTATGVDFNFNGWGGKQRHPNDSRVAAAVLERYHVPRITAPLVAEGGALETDGQGTLLVTESSVVNDNRNPGKDRQQVEADLKQTLGVRTVIWLAGVKGQDITDAHVDCLVRYVAPGVVLLDKAFAGGPPDLWSRSDRKSVV